MTSEQAAQLIDNTLDLVHQRLQDLEAQALSQEHKALEAEVREWRQPAGGHIDLMVFPGLSNSLANGSTPPGVGMVTSHQGDPPSVWIVLL